MVSKSEHETLIEDCENRESSLSDWERLFVNSISEQLCRGGSLTERQAEKLEAIWERVT